jgi:threonine/homoserine/homoserine lactone efflux protein
MLLQVMSADLILALAVFAFVASITPGPNNLMLLASGVNYGFRKTIPHMLGIGIGFMLMILLVGLGLGKIFEAWPALYTALKYLCAAYMLWLAWKIAHAGPAGKDSARDTPMTFMEAAAFQWVNPKAWVICVTAATIYTVRDWFVGSVIVITLIFGLVNIPSISVWTLFGMGLRGLLNSPRTTAIFNWTMAALLAASLWPLFMD